MIEAYNAPTVSQEIDGLTYTSTKFPATKGVQLMTRSVKALGEHGLQLLVATQAKALAEKVPRLVLSAKPRLYAAIVQVAYGLAEDITLTKDVLANMKVSALRPANVAGGDVGPNFDAHFSGELPHMFQVAAFALAHNFVGFTLGANLLDGIPGAAETTGETPSA